jgi:hypothetical protein
MDRPTFDNLLRKYLRGDLDTTQLYEQVMAYKTPKSNKEKDLEAELKRVKTRAKNKERKIIDNFKHKLEQKDMSEEQIASLQVNDVVTYVSPSGVVKEDTREEVIVSGGPFKKGGLWYVNIKPKSAGDDVEGTPTLINYLEKIG